MKDLKLGRQATIKKWNISLDGMSTTLAELCRHARVDVGFGKDKNGELYLLTKDDNVKIRTLIGSF